MESILWTGRLVLGLLFFASAGIVFFHSAGLVIRGLRDRRSGETPSVDHPRPTLRVIKGSGQQDAPLRRAA